jgi:tetratricopeptide (TPR) repeat protein
MYSQGLDCCPTSCRKERSVLYSNRAAANFHLIPPKDQGLTSSATSIDSELTTEVLSRKEFQDSVITDCTQALSLDPSYLKALQKRAEVYRDYDDSDAKLDECLSDFQRILELDPPNSNQVKQVIRNLEAQIQHRNERLKDEMLGKLKDLGNVLLKPFGLSTNNFEMSPNDSGGYSLNFKSNNQ